MVHRAKDCLRREWGSLWLLEGRADLCIPALLSQVFACQGAFGVGACDFAGYSDEVLVDEAFVFQPIEFTGKRERILFRHTNHTSLVRILLWCRVRGKGSSLLVPLALEVRRAADGSGCSCCIMVSCDIG